MPSPDLLRCRDSIALALRRKARLALRSFLMFFFKIFLALSSALSLVSRSLDAKALLISAAVAGSVKSLIACRVVLQTV